MRWEQRSKIDILRHGQSKTNHHSGLYDMRWMGLTDTGLVGSVVQVSQMQMQLTFRLALSFPACTTEVDYAWHASTKSMLPCKTTLLPNTQQAN